MNVIFCDFRPEFRFQVAAAIKESGRKAVEEALLAQSVHPSFVYAIVRSILRKEGW